MSKNAKIERKFIVGLAQPLSFTRSPFKPVAKRLGIEEKELLGLIKKYQQSGLIRRLTVILNHRRIGMGANVLLAWRVEPGKVNRIARIFCKRPFISHCYLRTSYPRWPYNLYTMLHAPDTRACLSYMKILLSATAIKDFRILYTLKEFKKTRMDLAKVLE